MGIWKEPPVSALLGLLGRCKWIRVFVIAGCGLVSITPGGASRMQASLCFYPPERCRPPAGGLEEPQRRRPDILSLGHDI